MKKWHSFSLEKRIIGGKYDFAIMDPGTYDYLTLTILVADTNQIENNSVKPF